MGQEAFSLTARRLRDTGRTVVASPAYLARAGTPQTPADLAAHNCLDFSFRRLEPGWPFREVGWEYLLAVGGNMQANNGETLVQLALAGVGITRVGNFHIIENLAAGRLVPLLEAFMHLRSAAIGGRREIGRRRATQPVWRISSVASPGSYSSRSPGWQASSRQIASKVENRIPCTLPDLSSERLASVMPMARARSFERRFRLANITSRRTTIGIRRTHPGRSGWRGRPARPRRV